MFSTIKKLLGLGPKVDLGELISKGAVIIDVRTPGEFASGHLKQAINIPLGTLQSRLAKLKKDKPVITCCASGMRSSSAKSMLKSKGFEQVYNGGSWQSLRKYEK
ncbi:MAG TPA: rhodanese-like domain-containing protein [Mucilaginibacter sp.]|jgi:rhodanese-related sulfurtransferase|nr:rhodanese-like domain-containing protein [Mucilaginibacter sp.]